MKRVARRKPRLVLVDDHPVVREGIRSYLSSRGVAEIVGEAATGAEALRQVRALRPDVVLMDINLPDVSGFVVTEKLRRELPDVRVLIVTMHASREYAVEIVRSGASGYLLKEAKPAEMVAAIQAVYAGDNYFSPAVAAFVLQTVARGKKGPIVKPGLSDRERLVLVLVADGKTSRDIATELGVTVRTVNTYRERLMAKTGIRKAADLTRYAIKERMIPLPRDHHAIWKTPRRLRPAA